MRSQQTSYIQHGKFSTRTYCESPETVSPNAAAPPSHSLQCGTGGSWREKLGNSPLEFPRHSFLGELRGLRSCQSLSLRQISVTPYHISRCIFQQKYHPVYISAENYNDRLNLVLAAVTVTVFARKNWGEWESTAPTRSCGCGSSGVRGQIQDFF